ncbi:hypothetical protein GCM10028817_40780 [Spirosoma pomorum]
MPVVPAAQEKGQSNSLVDKVDFGFGRLLINDLAYPILPKEYKIEFYLHNIALLTAIKTYHFNGRKWWI